MVDKTHLYVGAVVMTPITGPDRSARLGIASTIRISQASARLEGYAYTVAAYVSYNTGKLTINGRAEIANGSAFDACFRATRCTRWPMVCRRKPRCWH